MSYTESPPEVAIQSVLLGSAPMEPGAIPVRGYDFNNGVNYDELMKSYLTTGFQANHFGRAVKIINNMLDKRAEPVPEDKMEFLITNPIDRKRTNCTIFLGYTSNMISSGLREIIRYLVQHNMVDCIVTTAGGIEEDIIKCLAPTFLGDFNLPGAELRSRGMNRIGNLVIPNNNYCMFETWFMPLLDTMLEEQRKNNIVWSPSKLIWRLGKEINNTDSVYYWAYKNSIPVFCPAIVDGSLGDILYLHTYKNPGLIMDVMQDIRLMNNQAVFSVNTGMIILGGGVVKHHICNANLMRNGADYTVFINTGNEFDGSDSGARPDEAVSWGKIRATAETVKVYADATLVFPLVVAETFAKRTMSEGN